MPYYLNIICDHEDADCHPGKDGNPTTVVQSVGFDDVNETFQDVIDSIRGEGWTIEGDSPAFFKFFCPHHSSGT